MSSVTKTAGIDGTFTYTLSVVPDEAPKLTIYSNPERTVVAQAEQTLVATANPSVFEATYDASLAATTYYLGFTTVVTSGEPAVADNDDTLVLIDISGIVGDDSFATLAEFELRKGDVETAQEDIVSALLIDTTALIRDEASGSTATWVTGTDPAPTVIKSICIEAAYRAWSNPDALSQSSIADSSISYTREGTPDALFLTAAEKRIIRRSASTSGIGSVTLVTPYSGDDVTIDPDVGDL